MPAEEIDSNTPDSRVEQTRSNETKTGQEWPKKGLTFLPRCRIVAKKNS